VSRDRDAKAAGARRIRVLVIFCLLILVGLFAFSRFSRYHDLTDLRDHGAVTVGTVTKVDSSHNLVTYTFDAFSQHYTGQDSPSVGDGGLPASQLRSGTNVTVFYVPADPTISVIGDPESRIVTFEIGIAATVGIVFIIGVAGIYFFFFVGGRKGADVWKR
jgi:hypothetical protein